MTEQYNVFFFLFIVHYKERCLYSRKRENWRNNRAFVVAAKICDVELTCRERTGLCCCGRLGGH